MPLVFSKKVKDGFEKLHKEGKLSDFEYNHLHYLYCIHESLVSIAHNLEDINQVNKIPKGFTKIIKR